MSNTKSGPGTTHDAHLIPGIAAGFASRAGAGAGSIGNCCFNNPCEAWAYRVSHRHRASTRTSRGPLIWGDGVVLVASFLFFATIIALFSFTLASL